MMACVRFIRARVSPLLHCVEKAPVKDKAFATGVIAQSACVNCRNFSTPRRACFPATERQFQVRQPPACDLTSSLHNVPQVDLDLSDDRLLSPEQEDAVARHILDNLTEEERRNLKIIQLEFSVLQQMEDKIPEHMRDSEWVHALSLKRKSSRIAYYNFLAVRNARRKKKSHKKAMQPEEEEKAEESCDKKNKSEEPMGTKNTIFMMVYDTIIKKAGSHRLANAMQFGQPLVFDMDYEQFMRDQDIRNLVQQLHMTYGCNRNAMDPFHLVFTSLNPDGKLLQCLQKVKMTGANFMGTMTDRSYLDLFPKERLVYLSPHARNTLKCVNRDDVYIVGGFNDKGSQKPVSFARAKEQGIRCVKFPLDNHVFWGIGSKSLTLDQVMAILLEQRKTQDWKQALEFVPQRKLKY